MGDPLAIIRRYDSNRIAVDCLVGRAKLFPFATSNARTQERRRRLATFFFVNEGPRYWRISVVAPDRYQLVVVLRGEHSAVRVQFVRVGREDDRSEFHSALEIPVPFCLERGVLVF